REERKRRRLEDFFLVAKVPEGSDVGDDESDAELIVGTHLAESNAAVLDGDAAAFAVVADLHELILQGAVGDVVADPGGDIKTAAGFAAVAHEHAHLIGERLQDGIVLQAKMSNGGEEFAIGLDLQEGADDGKFVELRVEFQQILGIKAATGCDPEVTDDRRRVALAEGKSEWRDGVQRFKNVALSVENGSPERGIEVVLL